MENIRKYYKELEKFVFDELAKKPTDCVLGSGLPAIQDRFPLEQSTTLTDNIVLKLTSLPEKSRIPYVRTLIRTIEEEELYFDIDLEERTIVVYRIMDTETKEVSEIKEGIAYVYYCPETEIEYDLTAIFYSKMDDIAIRLRTYILDFDIDIAELSKDMDCKSINYDSQLEFFKDSQSNSKYYKTIEKRLKPILNNRTQLTRTQLILLFRNLNQHKLINYENDIDLSYSLSLVSGLSQEKIRQNVPTIDNQATAKDYDNIINKLEEVLIKLNKKKIEQEEKDNKIFNK